MITSRPAWRAKCVCVPPLQMGTAVALVSEQGTDGIRLGLNAPARSGEACSAMAQPLHCRPRRRSRHPLPPGTLPGGSLQLSGAPLWITLPYSRGPESRGAETPQRSLAQHAPLSQSSGPVASAETSAGRM